MIKLRTLTGRVSHLRKGVGANDYTTCCRLYFNLTVTRILRSPKTFRVCGVVFGAEQSILASQIRNGSQITVIGFVKGPDLGAMIQLPRLDLERLARVA